MDFYRVHLSEEGWEDINSIFDYFYFEENDSDRAKKITYGIYRAFFSLETTPYRYRLIHHQSTKYKNLRRMSNLDYNILFEINEEKKTVIIHKVIHSKRNWIMLIREEQPELLLSENQ